ncbi:MAG: hypothetical protein WBF07_08540, partial [Xanthobacteraceae bacterium]
GSLAVTGQDLLTGLADLRPVGLQAPQNAQDVLRIDLELGLAELGHVGMTGGAFLWVSVADPHSGYRRRLWRHLLGISGSTRRKRQSDRQD